jgi:hypothetical protein
MTCTPRFVWATILFALPCGLAVAAEPPLIAWEYPKDGLSISLPDDWKEIPPDIVREIRRVSRKEMQVSLEGMVHFFQPQSSAKPLSTPLVVVQILKSGRVSDRFLRQLGATNDVRKTVADVLHTYRIWQKDLFKVSFDTNRCLLKIDAAKRTGAERERVFGGTFFTEDGVINVACVAEEKDFDRWAQLFGQIVDSTQIAEAVRYRLRPPPDLSGGARDWFYVVIGMIVMGCVGLGYLFLTRLRDSSNLNY